MSGLCTADNGAGQGFACLHHCTAVAPDARQARQRLAEREAMDTGPGAIAGAPASVKDPTAANPPPRMVRGEIEKIHPEDNKLVQLNIGLDDGVDKNHTLEVIRLGTEPQYIGMIRIIDANIHSSTGRLIRTQFAPAKAVREGDQVVSSLEMVK